MAKSKNNSPLQGEALLKETNRRIRVAMAYWKAHNNRACRGEREKALVLYDQLTKDQKDKIPQQLRIWLRYRSVKYFGDHRTAPGTPQGKAKSPRGKSSKSQSPRTDQAASPSEHSPANPSKPGKSRSRSKPSEQSAAKRLPHQHKPSPGRKKKRNSKQG